MDYIDFLYPPIYSTKSTIKAICSPSNKPIFSHPVILDPYH